MSFLFNECRSLSYLPDISKWNTNNVRDMSYMFSGCISLSSLPDISKWNISNDVEMDNMLNNSLNIIFSKFIKKKFDEALLN